MKDFDYVKINSKNVLYIIIHEADGYIEEKMETYLTFASTDKKKRSITKVHKNFGMKLNI